MSRRGMLALSVFVLSAIVYISTTCPCVYTMDSGELIVAAHNLQIAHPTGYPLFCLLYKLGEYLVPFGSVALRMNIFNALLASLAVMVLFLAVSEVASKKASAFISLLFAFSPVFWDVATAAEVHALSALIVSSEILFFLKYWKSGERRYLYAIAILAGLGMANHMSSALVLPGMFFGILMKDKGLIRDWRLIIKCMILFVLPLSLYLYLPLRQEASRGSIWGDIYRASGFAAHVTGKAFRLRMFGSSPEALWGNFVVFLRLLVDQIPIYVAWVLPIGAVLARRRFGLLAAFGVMMLVNVLYGINYRIIDIETYYIPTMLLLSVFAALGIDFVLEKASEIRFARCAPVLLPVLLVLIAGCRFHVADKSDKRFVMDYAYNVLGSIEKDALFVGCGDSSYNALLYAREIEGKRPDVILVDRLIVNVWMPWEKDWTARYHYEHVSQPSKAMQDFRWPMRYSRREVLGEKLLADVIAETVKERPVYLACIGNDKCIHPVLKHLSKNHRLVPEGLAYRVYPKGMKLDYAAIARRNEELWRRFEARGVYDISAQAGPVEREIPTWYAGFHTALADIELKARMYSRAQHHYSRALMIEPAMLHARNGLGISFACQGRYLEACREWNTVLSLHPDNSDALRYLRIGRAQLASD